MSKRLWIQDHEHYQELFCQIRKLINFDEKYCVDSCPYMGINRCRLFYKYLKWNEKFLKSKVKVTKNIRCKKCIEIFGE